MNVREFFEKAAENTHARIARVNSYVQCNDGEWRYVGVHGENALDELRWSDISGDIYDPSFPDVTDEQLLQCVVYHPYLSYGDYDNSCDVERSNVKVLIEDEEDVAPALLEVFGGHGTHAVVFRYHPEAAERILEILSDLEDYPVIDEDHLSETRMNMIYEAWGNYGSDDFLHFLLGKDWSAVGEFKDEFAKPQESEDRIASALSEAWIRCVEYGSGCEEEIEAGGSVYFDYQSAVDNIGGRESVLDMVREFLKEDENE